MCYIYIYHSALKQEHQTVQTMTAKTPRVINVNVMPSEQNPKSSPGNPKIDDIHEKTFSPN